ncbi:gamma-glutamyltransferase [Asanoa sp. NPDC050611]|uniref:gamma-glutamyltransferase family protein n=1 Tax=Asanoa sp. NPDC050611 TaxID=3157098 RepID=UPI0033E7438B
MFTTRPELTGTFGMVASTHWLASQAGMAALEAGGNAFDAAVAAGLVLQVVEPHMNGPLGEVPIIGHAAATGETFVVDGQGPAPAGATIDHFAGLGLDLVPGTGLLPACVPGAFGAWLALLQAHGTMRFGDVASYAIGYADGGYPLPTGARDTIATVADLFRTEWTDSAAVYLPGGAVPVAGSRFRNPALAAMYRRLVDAGEAAGRDRDAQIDGVRAAFYDGFVAETIASYLDKAEALDSSGRRHKGVLAHGDLAGHRTRFEQPVTFEYHGYTVCKPGPWSQGPVFLQQLALLAGFDLADLPTDSPEFAHLVVECAKLAFADREAFYGDPRSVDVPLAALLGDDYNAARRALVGERASAELRPGSPGGRPPRLPALPQWRAAAAGTGEPTVARDGRTRGDTCHLDVVDRWGNLVSATPSGAWLSVRRPGSCSPAGRSPASFLCVSTRRRRHRRTGPTRSVPAVASRHPHRPRRSPILASPGRVSVTERTEDHPHAAPAHTSARSGRAHLCRARPAPTRRRGTPVGARRARRGPGGEHRDRAGLGSPDRDDDREPRHPSE